MKIWVLNPPFLKNFSRPQRSPAVTKSGTIYFPIWLAFCAATLEKAGHDIILTDAPAAGLEDRDLATYRAVLDALRPLRYVRGEAARMLFDEGLGEDEIVDFLVRYELVTEERARKTIEFLRAYRSYIFTYTVGEDLVDAYLGDDPDRAERFFDLLQRPLTPSDLTPE